MIFRDDDISQFTKLDEFERVHNLFLEYGVRHTISVIAKGIENNPELVNYILNHQYTFDIQLHCWEHVELSTLSKEELTQHLSHGIKSIQENFHVTPAILYPPWNKTSTYLDGIASNNNLKVSSKKVSLTQYIKVDGSVSEDTINFHYWHDPEVIMLEQALRIFIKRKSKCL